MRSVDEPLPLTFQVRQGRVLVRQGDAYRGAWIVGSGTLSMGTVDPDGRRLTIDVLGRGDLVGGPPGWIAEATVHALTEAWLAPAGSAALRDGLARRAHRASSLACALAWDRVADRLAARLEDLAERFGRPVPGGRCIGIPLTQEDLAALTGSTRETVNRALAELGRQGRVSGGGSRPLVVRGGRPSARTAASAPGG